MDISEASESKSANLSAPLLHNLEFSLAICNCLPSKFFYKVDLNKMKTIKFNSELFLANLEKHLTNLPLGDPLDSKIVILL